MLRIHVPVLFGWGRSWTCRRILILCINNSTLTGNKILLHGPSQWVRGHPRVMQKPTFSTAGVRALKRDVAEGLHTEKNGSSGLCCDWINHLWAGSEHTDRGEELQNIYAASAAAPDELFKTCSVTFICKKKVMLEKFHYSLTTLKHNLFPSRAQCRAI